MAKKGGKPCRCGQCVSFWIAPRLDRCERALTCNVLYDMVYCSIIPVVPNGCTVDNSATMSIKIFDWAVRTTLLLFLIIKVSIATSTVAVAQSRTPILDERKNNPVEILHFKNQVRVIEADTDSVMIAAMPGYDSSELPVRFLVRIRPETTVREQRLFFDDNNIIVGILSVGEKHGLGPGNPLFKEGEILPYIMYRENSETASFDLESANKNVELYAE